MAGLLSFFIGVILLSGVVRSDDCYLTPFSKKVRVEVLDDSYYDLFRVSYENLAEFKKDVRKGIEEFNQDASVTIPASISEEVKEEAEKVRASITSDELFQIFTNAVFFTLEDEGKITRENEDKLAKSYADFLNDAATRLRGEDLSVTLPAIIRATAEFFKTVGIYGDQDKLRKFGDNLFSEVDKIYDNTQSDYCDMIAFRKKVRSLISDYFYYNLFYVSYKNKEDFKKAVQKAIDNFNQEAGVKIPASISTEIKEKAAKVGDFVTPDQLFQANADAVYLFLKNEGKLTKHNLDKLARSYAHYLKKAAKKLKNGDLFYTLPAITKATAKFFKHLGIYGDQSKLQKFGEYLFSEVDKIYDNAQRENSKSTPFAKKSRSLIPDYLFDDLFYTSAKSPEDFRKAVRKGIDEFNQDAGVTIPPCISEEIKDDAEKVRDSITPEQFFRIYANAISRFLYDEGKLTKKNEDRLAKSFAHYLKKEAKHLKGEDLLYTLSAVNRATAKFFKHLGIYGDQTKLQKFGEYLFSEIDKNY